MKRFAILAAALATSAVAFSAVEQEVKPNPHQLLGAWRLIAAKYNGRGVNFPADPTTVKLVTPEQFMWATYDRNGRITEALGGSYTVEENHYAETPRYGLSTEALKAKTRQFEWKIEGNLWRHEGKSADGVTVEEVWERVEKK